jgi:hypothetical protein
LVLAAPAAFLVLPLYSKCKKGGRIVSAPSYSGRNQMRPMFQSVQTT